MAKNKFYVVWAGRETGIFSDWEDCKKQVQGYEGAKYKGFPTQEAAKLAYNNSYWEFVGNKPKPVIRGLPQEGFRDSIAVDAACSGNPGLMEYRGVDIQTGEELFRQGPYEEGTNNVGEFLALVHGMALLKRQREERIIYSDSRNAILWVKQKKCKTKLKQTQRNKAIFELIARAEKWLDENTYTAPILKWETKEWGEIPADFGRK
jgi:ribonuclease HI